MPSTPHTGDPRPALRDTGGWGGIDHRLHPHNTPCSPHPHPRYPHPGTHSAWVKALSPSGTAVSPFPEQSTRRSPSQLQGAAQRGGAAPLGSAEPRSPRARKQSSPSGPGIAAAASRAGLSRGAARSARLRCPPTPPRPAGGLGRGLSSLGGRAGSAPSTVRGSSAGTRRSGVSPFPLLHGSAEAAPLLRRLRPASRAVRSCRGRALPSHRPPCPRPPAAAALQGCGAQPSAMPAPRPSPRPALVQTPRLLLALSPPQLNLLPSFSLLGLHARVPKPPAAGLCKSLRYMQN